jgi:hypothetical protein
MNQPGLTIKTSNSEAQVDYFKNSSFIQVSGKTSQAMTMEQTLMFVYADQYLTNLLATVAVEVQAR